MTIFINVKWKRISFETMKKKFYYETFDMGDISMSRYSEMLGSFWVPLYKQLGTMKWGFRLVKTVKGE